MCPELPNDWLEDYGDNEPVIDPGRHVRELAERAAAEPGSESALLTFASFMSPTVGTISADLDAHQTWRPSVSLGTLDGSPAAVAELSAGAAPTIMLVEECIAGGARTLLVGGAVGSLQRHITIGDYIVPTSARREEGTSFHYAGSDHEATASGPATQALLKAARDGPRRVHEGPVWSTDALYREFRGKAVHYAAEGDLGVDMETSALMTVAAVRGVDVGIILTVSDHIFDPHWGNIFGTPGFNKNCVELARIMVSAGRKLVTGTV